MAQPILRAATRQTNAATEAARQERLSGIADQTLKVFADTANKAQARLDEPRRSVAGVLASVNTLTAVKAIQNLDGISGELRRGLIQLINEPAIARLDRQFQGAR